MAPGRGGCAAGTPSLCPVQCLQSSRPFHFNLANSTPLHHTPAAIHYLAQGLGTSQISPLATASIAMPAAPERFLAFKEMVIDNGLSNTRSALRVALAVAHVLNRTLILPQVCHVCCRCT